MGRILGIDFGSRRVGLALSDAGRLIASPLRTLEYRDTSGLIQKLTSLIQELRVAKIVVGLPLNMKGERTSQTILVEEFASTLQEKTPVPIDFIDERLTSVEAIRVLHRRGLKPSRNKGMIDKTAAAIFLQSYLDRLHTR
ncbi:MAG: Holliday junction resolvase RuvX [Candidatus Neomarinimicrobiota bacterium]